MPLDLNVRVRERRFVCGATNCHQKFVSASAVARHTARVHQTDGRSDGKAHVLTLALRNHYVYAASYKVMLMQIISCPHHIQETLLSSTRLQRLAMRDLFGFVFICLKSIEL